MKKLTALILILSLTVTLFGCEAESEPESVLGAYTSDKTEETQPEVQKSDIAVLYYKDMDTNPVTTDCYANSELLKLVYCPLIRTDSSLKPYCVLAKDFSQDGTRLTVTLRPDLVFSDGSAVTAKDVVKSFDVAKKNAQSPYNSQLGKIKSYYAEDDSTFVCIFNDTLIDAAALLDIPVMKNGREAIGCGPYVFSEINGKSILTVNENYFECASIPTIYLTETKSDENISTLFSAGELDIVLGAQSTSLSLTSLRDYSIVSYPSNNLIYIGINHGHEKLADAAVRRALSNAVNRNGIASQSLVGLADSTEYPFNPNWYRFSSISEETAVNPPSEISGISLNMLIPSGSDIKKTVAAAITESLKSAGVTVEITELEPAQLEARLSSGDFELYLGETAISRTMDPTFIYSDKGFMNYGGYADAELDNAFSELKNGSITVEDYFRIFSERMPIIPVVFKRNVIYCDKSLGGFEKQSPWNSLGSFTAASLN